MVQEFDSGGRAARPDKTKLSGREEQIIGMAMEGLTDKQIAIRLEISVATVKSYWVRIRQKIGSYNRAETVAKKLRTQDVMNTGGFPLQQWWGTMCRYAPWSIIVMDQDGRIGFVSRVPEKGAAEHLMGRRLADLCRPVERSYVNLALQEVLRGRSVECRVSATIAPGMVVELNGRLAPIEESGGVTGALFFVDLPQPAASAF